jgi:ion channel
MLKFVKKNRNMLLFITLISFFFLLPFLTESTLSGFVLTGFLSLVLVFSVFAAGSTKKVSRIAVLLGGVALLTGWWDSPYIQTSESIVISKIAFCLFFVFVATMLLKRIFNTKKITANTIYAAACVYILMGMCWAFIYTLIEFINPGAFSFPDSSSGLSVGGSHFMFFDFFYYSFVTITTIGYGDIVPVSKTGKMLSVLEGLTGQLFIALLVARLVGMYTAQQHHDRMKE